MGNAHKQVCNSGLLAYWPFDEGHGSKTIEIVTGNSYDINYVFNEARYKPDCEPLWWRGISGDSLLFDGYSTWVSCPDFQLDKFTEGLTIEVWVAPRSYESPEDDRLAAIVNQHDRDSCKGFVFGVHKYGRWGLKLGLGDEWIEIREDDNLLPAYTWSYVCAVYDGKKGLLGLYLNGKNVAIKEITPGKTIKPANVELLIGKNNQAAVLADVFSLNMFDGLIDELKIYNRPLNSSEIKANFASYISVSGGKIPEIHYDDIAIKPEVYDGDRHRPQYHLIAPGHWMNEPHGPIYFNGQYHLFYQHNPRGPYWHNIHWGHWVSTDMVHWRHLPPALTPEKDAVDPDGDWSGSATYDEKGLPVLFFTAANRQKTPDQSVALARTAFPEDGDNDLVNWIKDNKPVITQPQGLGLTPDFRDPFSWKEGDCWYCLVGSGVKAEGGTALVFKSDNLQDWEFKGHLYRSDYEKYPFLGPVWELPVLLPLGRDSNGVDKHIFLISPVGEGADVEVFYWIGIWDKEECHFIPDREEPQLIDYGDFHFTGPSGMVDPRTGRKILFTIAQGERTPRAEYDAGWAHNGGLPLSLYLREDDHLGIEPIEELNSLRGEKLIDVRNYSKADTNQVLTDIKGDMLEIKLIIEPDSATRFGIKVRKSPGNEEETLIYYDKDEASIFVDREKSSLDPDALCKGVQGGKVYLKGENLNLHIYLDKSMVECYVNSLKSITTRVYPSRSDATGIEIWSDSEDITVKSLLIWKMKSAYEKNNLS